MVYYLLAILLVLLAFAVVYRSFMLWFEGRERDFLSALQVVVQTVTTVGYGEDAPWQTPQLNILVIIMQLTGLVILFMLLPLFVLPWLEERLKWRWIPTQVPRRMRDHVVVCGHSPLAETLAHELDLAGRSVLFVVREAELAARLEARWPAIHGDVSHVDDLRRAGAHWAQALVANESDERNAAMILSASAFPHLYVLAVAGSPRAKAYLSYAGADVVVSPRESTALALTNKALTGSPFHLEDLAHVAPGLEVAELPVLPGSSLIGRTLGDAEVGEETGANVIGLWAKGDFVFSPGPATWVGEGSVLVAAGTKGQLERLEELTLSSRWRAAQQEGGRVLILGCEEVAKAQCAPG
ncbi:MAG: NAD-binding protein [Candidatus Bipolaricaulota bacterium]